VLPNWAAGRRFPGLELTVVPLIIFEITIEAAWSAMGFNRLPNLSTVVPELFVILRAYPFNLGTSYASL